MSHKFAAIALIPVFLTLAACGGSSHSASSTTTATQAATSASSTSLTGSTTATTSKKPSAGSSNARIPVRLEVRSGGALSPPQVSVPAKLALQVTVISKDGRGHRVVVTTPQPAALNVPANGQASQRIPGPKPGRYRIEVDGRAAGLLVTGVNPGP